MSEWRMFLYLNLEQRIEWLRQHGSSLIMNWGEEGYWEIDWISGGERFGSVGQPKLSSALFEVVHKAYENTPALADTRGKG